MKVHRIDVLCLRSVATALLAVLGAAAAGAQAPAESPATTLWCLPDTPAVEPGGTVELTARVAPAPARPFRFGWSAQAGQLAGSQGDDRATASWNLAGVAPGTYTVSVEARDEAGTFILCTLQVEVLAPVRGGYDPTRSLLAQGEREDPRYGLYSYLLLSAPPPDERRQALYLATLRAYLDKIPAIEALVDLSDGAGELQRWNVTYVPVDLPGEGAGDAVQGAEELLARYHYAWSQHFLRQLSRLEQAHSHLDRGPYLVSALDPLHSLGETSGPILIQDLSAVPPELAGAWVAAFLNQTAQIRYWERGSLEHLRLLLRTGIGIVAEAIPEVQGGIDHWISWLAR